MTSPPEFVVIVNEEGEPIGTRLKSEVHDSNTPRHLAFSCYLYDEHGQILVTRRALSKKTWPGVWTNSFCGHPAPDEKIDDAILRRARQELGATVTQITTELPNFSYRAVDASGIVENEICPVSTAQLIGPINPNPEEVCEWQWVTPSDLIIAVAAAPFAFSPWMRKQLLELQSRSSFVKGQTND